MSSIYILRFTHQNSQSKPMTLRNIFVALITFLGLATALDGKSTNKHVIPKILERFVA